MCRPQTTRFNAKTVAVLVENPANMAHKLWQTDGIQNGQSTLHKIWPKLKKKNKQTNAKNDPTVFRESGKQSS